MAERQKVEFRTLDGLVLRGNLWAANSRASSVIMTPGFNCTQDMFIPEVAVAFYKAGFTVLTYDPRSTGLSDGQPRNDIDPMKQIEDYSDAVSFLSDHPSVDADKIFIWGFSFAGTVALCAAALDMRVKGVVAVCPLVNLESDKAVQVLRKSVQDRASRLQGNEPLYVPLLNESGYNPAGFGVGVEKENYALILNAERTMPQFQNRTTIQTYYRLLVWQPFALWQRLTPTPTMFVVPEKDSLSNSTMQIAHFSSLKTPKKLYVGSGKGHMDILSGEGFNEAVDSQIRFLLQVVSDTFQSED